MKITRPPTEIWIHALAAKVGGGITYLRNILPEIVAQLEGRGVRVVLLLHAPLTGVALPEWFEVRVLPRASGSFAARLCFDQVLLPLWLWPHRKRAVLFCSASFAPLLKPAPTVVLLRNAIYFDEVFLSRDTPRRRRSWRLQGWLIAAAARGCRAAMYPSHAMRQLTETAFPSLRPNGAVNYYGISAELRNADCEVVHDSVTGLQVDPEDSAEIFQALCKLLSDEDLRTRLGQAGQARQARLFSLESFDANAAKILRGEI